MTEAEAQEFLAKTIIVFIGQDGDAAADSATGAGAWLRRLRERKLRPESGGHSHQVSQG